MFFREQKSGQNDKRISIIITRNKLKYNRQEFRF